MLPTSNPDYCCAIPPAFGVVYQKPRRASGRFPSIILQLSLAAVLVGMVAVLVIWAPTASTHSAETQMAVVLGAAVALSIVLDLHGMSATRPPLTFRLLLVAITLAGLPALFWNPSDALERSIPFFVLLALRNYVCFTGIPQSRIAAAKAIERAVMWWTLAATAFVSVGTVLIAGKAGVSLQYTDRFIGETSGWLNMNTVGVYCAFGVLVCVMATSMPRWARYLVGASALYALVVTQSRTSIAALVAALAVHFAIVFTRRKSVAVAALVLLVAVLAVSHDSLLALGRSVPQVDSIMNRFLTRNRSDDLRAIILQHGLETWARNPVFGSGYASVESRFENGYLSMACETGVVGLTLYLGFVLLVVKQGKRLLRTHEGVRAHTIGRYLLCTSAFMLVHAMGERSHGFQIGSMVSNCWAILASLAFTVPLPTHQDRPLRPRIGSGTFR